MDSLSLDIDRIRKALPPELRQSTAKRSKEVLSWVSEYNSLFFDDQQHYLRHTVRVPRALDEPDLYPPNLAVIDWVIRHGIGGVHLDIGCGLGMLLFYLRHLGVEAYGWDDGTQLPRLAAYAMLGNDQWLLRNLDDVEPTSISMVSIKQYLHDYMEIPSARVAFVEERYILANGGKPKTWHPGWTPVAWYPRLMIVFKRNVCD